MHEMEPFLMTVSDFCNSWGNFASVAGLLISLLGFGITIWGILRVKKAAEQAADAARQEKGFDAGLKLITDGR